MRRTGPSLPPPRPPACRVCGCREVRTDEVEAGELLWLGACPRCEHRWTARASAAPAAVTPPQRAAVAPPRPASEAASAA